MKKTFLLILFVAISGFPGLTQAQEKQKEAPSVPTMQEVVVTATRSERTVDKIGGNTATVITSEDIEAKKQMTVEEVLKGIPGLDVAANGGLGSQTSVFIRGADSKNTLVLVDGVMFNDPSSPTRSADLGNLTVDNIERIEVVRGPMSVLYGSNATAGVVNIITKKGRGRPTVHVGAEGGSFNTWKVYGDTAGAYKKFNFSVSGSRTETGGFSIADDDNRRILHDGNTSEKDGWKNTTVTGKFGVDITPDFDINGTVRYLDSETKLDDYFSGNFPDFNAGYAVDQVDFDPATFLSTPNPNGTKKQQVDNQQLIYKADIHNFFFERIVESTLYFQGSNLERDGLDADGAASFDLDGKTQEFGWQGSFNHKDINLLYLGASYFKEFLDSNASSLDKDQNITSFWVQDQLFIGDGFDIIGGIRYDDHERAGSATTFRIAPAYTFQQTETTIKGSYGTGFRAPSLFELFSDYGNENLKEEKSKGWDVGIEQPVFENKVRLGVTYFDMQFEDRIDFDMSTYAYNQLPGGTKTKGLEAFVRFTPISDLTFLLNYTYTDTEDPEGKPLVRRPENKVSLNARYRFLEKGTVNLDVYWVDERKTISSAKDVNGNRVEELDAYTLVNVSAHYDLFEWMQVYGRIDNLFDEFYEEAWSFATPGISAFGGVKFSF
ncbi:MAG TPA: TonB-dependent receptor [Deltaproteobacteria bacterium]|nr:TonB-dependent receptor [Deltaproteobacteria bacterium]